MVRFFKSAVTSGLSIHIDRISREKINSATAPVDISPSKAVVTSLKLDKSRVTILDSKGKKNAMKKVSDTCTLLKMYIK